ncbi:SDR family NAD(P)-dependent oxidoreductase [Rhizobium sp. SIMBA_035]
MPDKTNAPRRVVAITGASSGIARAAATAFATQGAASVVAARDLGSLKIVADECRQAGGTCLAFPVDVSDPDQVTALRDKAIEAFGRIDVWVNCAAVLMFGRSEDEPLDAFRRVIDVNLFGYVYGTRAALGAFRNQGDIGVLINVASMLGFSGEPYLGAYVASKAAIRGYTTCTRQEMRPFRDIHICTVLPVAIDTSIYQKGANYVGRKARSLVPLYDVERVARTIVKLADRPRAETIVGTYGYLMSLGLRLSPSLVERIISWLAPNIQFEATEVPVHHGNLFESSAENSKHGGWRRYWWGTGVANPVIPLDRQPVDS